MWTASQPLVPTLWTKMVNGLISCHNNCHSMYTEMQSTIVVNRSRPHNAHHESSSRSRSHSRSRTWRQERNHHQQPRRAEPRNQASVHHRLGERKHPKRRTAQTQNRPNPKRRQQAYWKRQSKRIANDFKRQRQQKNVQNQNVQAQNVQSQSQQPQFQAQPFQHPQYHAQMYPQFHMPMPISPFQMQMHIPGPIQMPMNMFCPGHYYGFHRN